MPRSIYVLDTSALVFKYIPSSDRAIAQRLNNLFAEAARSRGRIDLQLPNICMAECSKVFAGACFEEEVFGKRNQTDAFRKLCEALLDDVMRDRVINSYELRREHFQGIDEIFIRDYALGTPRGMSSWLSSHDALIIAMARHLKAEDTPVCIVTADTRMVDVCASDREFFSDAVNVRVSDIV